MGRTNKSKKRKSRGRRELIALANLGGLPVSELRRSPKTTEIALDDLPLPSVVPYPEFSRRLKRVYTGIAPFAFTRIPVADIPYGQNIRTHLPTGGSAPTLPALRLVFHPTLA